MIRLMGEWELKKMRAAGAAAAELLDLLGSYVAPGISTDSLNSVAERWAAERGFINAPLGYLGGGNIPFPKSICCSVNSVVCHGIPSAQEILKDGDIINIDVSPKVEGYIGDTSRTFTVGKVSDLAQHLVDITRECLMLGIEAVKLGGHVGDIGAAISNKAAENGFSVVRSFVGHGVGRVFHTDPIIPHFGVRFSGIRLERGMVFTIEPMLNAGSSSVIVADDGWSASTKDGSLSAQFEHTVAVVSDGVEILTASSGHKTV